MRAAFDEGGPFLLGGRVDVEAHGSYDGPGIGIVAEEARLQFYRRFSINSSKI